MEDQLKLTTRPTHLAIMNLGNEVKNHRKIMVGGIVLVLAFSAATFGLTLGAAEFSKESKVNGSGMLVSAADRSMPVETGTARHVTVLSADLSIDELAGSDVALKHVVTGAEHIFHVNEAKKSADGTLHLITPTEEYFVDGANVYTVSEADGSSEAFTGEVYTSGSVVDETGGDKAACPARCMGARFDRMCARNRPFRGCEGCMDLCSDPCTMTYSTAAKRDWYREQSAGSRSGSGGGSPSASFYDEHSRNPCDTTCPAWDSVSNTKCIPKNAGTITCMCKADGRVWFPSECCPGGTFGSPAAPMCVGPADDKMKAKHPGRNKGCDFQEGRNHCAANPADCA